MTSNNTDPRYRYGDAEEPILYLLYKNDEENPRAGFLMIDGYAAFYDFVLSICGSNLSDITEKVTWETFSTEYLVSFMEQRDQGIMENFQVVQYRVPEEYMLTDIGLSINDVQESARFLLLEDAFRFSGETDAQEIVDFLVTYV